MFLLISVLAELLMIGSSAFMMTCGVGIVDILIIALPIIGTFMLNQLFFETHKRQIKVLVVLCGIWNIFLGWLSHGVIC